MSRDVSPLDLLFQLRRDVDYRGDLTLEPFHDRFRGHPRKLLKFSVCVCVCVVARFVEEDAP